MMFMFLLHHLRASLSSSARGQPFRNAVESAIIPQEMSIVEIGRALSQKSFRSFAKFDRVLYY